MPVEKYFLIFEIETIFLALNAKILHTHYMDLLTNSEPHKKIVATCLEIINFTFFGILLKPTIKFY